MKKKNNNNRKKKAAEVDLIRCFCATHCNQTHGHMHADRYVPALCARHCNDPESGSDSHTDKEEKKGKAKKGGREENQQVTHFVFFYPSVRYTSTCVCGCAYLKIIGTSFLCR